MTDDTPVVKRGLTYHVLIVAKDLYLKGDIDTLIESGFDEEFLAFLSTLSSAEIEFLDQDYPTLFTANLDKEGLAAVIAKLKNQ